MNICDGGVIVMREWMVGGRFLEHIIVELIYILPKMATLKKFQNLRNRLFRVINSNVK